MTIKAIETRYKGYLFRSRLEARWAVFFDTLGLRWEYEKEGFNLGAAGCYLPDFWLPQQKLWVEVKPKEFRPDCINQIKALAIGTGKAVAVLSEDIGPFKHTMNYVYDEELCMNVPGDCNFFGSHWGVFPYGCGAGYTESLKPGECDFMDGCASFAECVGCGMIGFEHFGDHSLCACICDGTYVPRRLDNGMHQGFRCRSCGDYTSEHPRSPHLANRNEESPRLLKAYAAARSARFEHGQSGAQL